MAFIKILTGERKGTRIEIDRDEVVFGRAPDNLIVLKDESISSKHCAIIRSGRNFVIRDLGSTNGTLLNDVSILEHQLSPGDNICAGNVEILFDGTDIDPYEAVVPSSEEDPQVTIKMAATRSNQNSAFNKRKQTSWIGYTLWTLVGVLTIGAMAFFLVILLK